MGFVSYFETFARNQIIYIAIILASEVRFQSCISFFVHQCHNIQLRNAYHLYLYVRTYLCCSSGKFGIDMQIPLIDLIIFVEIYIL